MRKARAILYWAAIVLATVGLWPAAQRLRLEDAKYRQQESLRRWMRAVAAEIVRLPDPAVLLTCTDATDVYDCIRGQSPEAVRFLELIVPIDPQSGAVLDPWGHAVSVRPLPPDALQLLSPGPNGRLEDGGGDDIGLLVALEIDP